MFRWFRRYDDEELEHRRRRKFGRRNLSTRLAWGVLVGGCLLVLIRVSTATVVKIHGDGMAPTIRDSEYVMMVRGSWGIDRGDLVVYEPVEAQLVAEQVVIPVERPGQGETQPTRHADATRAPRGQLRNTAVIDPADLGISDDNWDGVQKRTQVDDPSNSLQNSASLRVGRVLARPGDTVTFNVPGAAMGLAINGKPLVQKPGASVPLATTHQNGLRPSAHEQVETRAYQVLLNPGQARPRWPVMGLPEDNTPVEMKAEGFLILADNRDEGACCDSRAVGWVHTDKVRGEVLARLGSSGNPARRSFEWRP
ncbi:MAG: S24/S26 family peptidase [Nannocystaceae bacterium]